MGKFTCASRFPFIYIYTHIFLLKVWLYSYKSSIRMNTNSKVKFYTNKKVHKVEKQWKFWMMDWKTMLNKIEKGENCLFCLKLWVSLIIALYCYLMFIACFVFIKCTSSPCWPGEEWIWPRRWQRPYEVQMNKAN